MTVYWDERQNDYGVVIGNEFRYYKGEAETKHYFDYMLSQNQLLECIHWIPCNVEAWAKTL